MALNENIRIIRQNLGLSQARFAAEVGVDQMTISRWERGVSRPRAHYRQRIRALMEEVLKDEEVADGGDAGTTREDNRRS
jgi:transcriptional regulator with XRE-family HTH domain